MKRSLILFIVSILPFAGIAQPNQPPKPKHSFTVIAHRGSHLYYPENTLQAYQQAINDQADYVEIDLRTSRDGALVSLHNATVDHMTGERGTIRNMTLQEVLALKVKSKDSLDKTIYRIPTFEQILQLCQGKIYIYIDLKDASAQSTCELLKKYNMQRQVLVYINSEEQFRDWRNVDKEMPLMISLPDSITTPEQLKEFVSEKRPDLLDGGWKQYSSEMINMANSLQVPVWPDIQSKEEGPAIWQQAIEKGFKGLQTDQPIKLIKYLVTSRLVDGSLIR